jgi:hypothetical protein
MKTLLMTLAAAGAAGGVTPALAQVGYYGGYAPANYAPANYAPAGHTPAGYTPAGYAANYAAPAGGHYDSGGDHLDYDPSPVHGAGAGLGRPAPYTPAYGGYAPSYAGYGAYGGYGAAPAYGRPAACGTGYPSGGFSSHHSYNGRPAGFFGLGW